MSSAQRSVAFPGNVMATTLNVSFALRATEGVGAYGGGGAYGLNNLTIAVTGGASEGGDLNSYLEFIIQYVENSSISSWYSPVSGTLRSNLRTALDTYRGPGVSTSGWLNVFFDGQFGSVLVA